MDGWRWSFPAGWVAVDVSGWGGWRWLTRSWSGRYGEGLGKMMFVGIKWYFVDSSLGGIEIHHNYPKNLIHVNEVRTMAASQAHLEKMQLRQSYRNVWHTDLMSTISADTPYCCFSLFCGPCVSYLLRKRALYNDMSRYTCCAGYMPCSGKCGESKCPELCLCTEVFLCFGNSVASTRFLLQDEFDIQTTQCDNCIIGFMFCLQQLACICSIVACLVGNDELSDASQALNCLADVVYCSVCACMQTQHKVEMDKRDGKFGPRPMAVPPAQQMSRFDQPYPPNVGYGQPQYAGYPPGPPPAPQAQGYPPAAYPPQGYPAAGYQR